ncbi:MAG: glucose-1-phosphate adenylyltransferase [Fusobacteriaceae bacterium]
MKKEILAMILAGGQGSRLYSLTEKIAKPAVPFGGRFRIIDFTISNCTNSGIDTVGVLTQYEPHVLNRHIGDGAPWDLNRKNGGVTVLQPHTTIQGGNWYLGTADAIFKNIPYIDEYNPEHILILSGDHIYKMDYAAMLRFHKKREAEATISVLKVPMEEASRFGIMNTNEDFSVYEFDEKPANPKSDLASMGIYIFNWKTLRAMLLEDAKDENSEHDFGKNIIPKFLNENRKVFAYPFKGYWKDVGTIKSLWEANMDLIADDNALDLFDEKWKIYTRMESYPPQYLSPTAKISNSLIDEGCEIEGEVRNSVIFSGVKIGKNSKVIDSVVMKNCVIEDDVIIEKLILANDVRIKKGTKLKKEEDIQVIPFGEIVGGGDKDVK